MTSFYLSAHQETHARGWRSVMVATGDNPPFLLHGISTNSMDALGVCDEHRKIKAETNRAPGYRK
jgi:hypothetical protein